MSKKPFAQPGKRLAMSYVLVRASKRGQFSITVPKHIAEKNKLSAGTILRFVSAEEDTIKIIRADDYRKWFDPL
jgi:hypothetical protein